MTAVTIWKEFSLVAPYLPVHIPHATPYDPNRELHDNDLERMAIGEFYEFLGFFISEPKFFNVKTQVGIPADRSVII